MNIQADKTSENKSQAVANSLPKLQSNGKSSTQFVDNRLEAVAQRKLQEANNDSPREQQLKAHHEMANNSPKVKQLRAYQAMADSFTAQTTQRKENIGEETLQGKFEYVQRKVNNTGLPDNLKAGIENLSGYSMNDVKVHYNSDKPAQLNAHAYAQGTNIHLAPEQEKHLPHEAWHVVQQKQGRVKPTMQMKGEVDVNDDDSLEKEADVMGGKAVQMKHSDEYMTDLTASQRSKNAIASTVLQSKVLQRRALNAVERENLADARNRFANLKINRAAMADTLTQRGGFGDTLGYFQNLGWDGAVEEMTKLNTQFTQMADLERGAINNHKACAEFIAKVNFYDRSGGMNRFYNIFKKVEKGLLSKERNSGTQFTGMDEIAFQKYLPASKSPVTVYRGAGWGGLDPTTFNQVAFADIAAGGSKDISFRGVVEHTWENNKKNGMVSCTTSVPIALGFATDSHTYGIVWELSLDNYIHVTDLLKTRNWKYRFPGQFEVLYPGSIPASKIVRMTLYQGTTQVATRTP